MATPDLGRFLSENQEEFYHKSFPETLLNLFKEKKLPKASVARKSGISNVYLLQILSGKRTPSCNRILSLCFGLSATVKEALLKL